ncbi:vitamin K epoxide reductase family protein [Rhodococcus sp. 1R11]|uniref:vitamin K epoxide reductase family protein n=1 Tax=Rhodococcus sp. 1R11 TaxID=2559614 RepID=UPI001072D831|nr:vitamin K epoxide reductase family protein [Rhodococcus sp. 1R11]TFI45538.1 vitamin K epoxide reductase family protein [Rhodococcus sp. 1R11]
MTTRAGAAVFTLFSALGLLAALTLTIERFKLLEDASYVPSCSLNPVLSCGSVMVTKQAALFGFPNPILGIVAFSVALVAGVLWLGRVELPHWFWLGLSAGLLLGEVFVHWLIFESLYEINALCPYCMVVWAVTMPLFVLALSRLISTGSNTTGADAGTIGRLFLEWRWTLLAVWYAIVVALIGIRFSDYWASLL